MATIERNDDAAGRMLGWGGLLLALAGCGGIVWLSEAVSGTARLPAPVAIGLIAPLVLAAALAVLPATRESSLTWLLSGLWSGLLAALTIFSVGIIFLIATVFLLAAFVKANW
jgi:hypothetical protein